MDPKLRIVKCPKCRAYLQEPPVGNPFYECGNCFATLQAFHATPEDVERRLQQKFLQLKRFELDKNTKSVSSEDGNKVFTSESSSEKSIDREEHVHGGEGSPSWSPSIWESPLYGIKRQPQPHHQRKAVESSDNPQHHPPGEVSRAKQDILQDKVDLLGQNLNRLGVEDNDEMQQQNRANASSEWTNGHGALHLSMRRSRPEELQHEKEAEGHQSHVHQVQKSVSFNDSASRNSTVLDRSLSFSNDLQPGSRMGPSDTVDAVEDSIHHILDDFLSARYDAKPQFSRAEGYEIQRDNYAATDVAEYGTNSFTSSIGEGDVHHAAAVEHQPRPHSGEPDSYVVLDHRVTRPGPYQRSSSASRHPQLNTAFHHSTDGQERNNSDGEKSSPRSPRSQSTSRMQQRPMSYHVQQPSHVPHQSAGQSPPHYVYNKPPGQNYHLSHETNLQNGPTNSYPFFPRPDEVQIVQCQHCDQHLGVPANLPPPKKSYQKLRCGACSKVSVFLVPPEEHFPSPAISPKGRGPFSDFSTASAPNVFSPHEAVNRHVNHAVKFDSEPDRGHPSIAPGLSQRLPPISRNIPRVPSGSKLSAMTSATTGTAMMGHAPVSNGVSNLHPATGAMSARVNSSSHYGEGATYRRSHSAYGPNGEHIMSTFGARQGNEYDGHHLHDGRVFQTSSESDNDSPRMRPPASVLKGEQIQVSSRMPVDRHAAQQYSKDEGYMQEENMASSMNLKGVMKKGVKERERAKAKEVTNNNLYRRQVMVNGSLIPDALLKRAEGLAGPIQTGSYWYDSQAGFWGLSGGPCLGVIPPHIEELCLQPLSRHCSGGQTGVVVNGRELHKSDYDLLVRRGLPPTPGKMYFVDIEGHVLEAVSGSELRGLGQLAPLFDQASRGYGMRVPGTGQVA